ncbi:PREDICTED: eukaryotic translation initiation factor 3 subunit H [Merops nubicus]|uniref:eukaryotic translation initiation factor 3 subunit H n=1 Tax=Merops nubicus TaxID=57421 RepID=UPI0004F0A536|nr:PREDICTED: eukaryotic translation initiation factor 3 subunit H [Merops nubicus]
MGQTPLAAVAFTALAKPDVGHSFTVLNIGWMWASWHLPHLPLTLAMLLLEWNQANGNHSNRDKSVCIENSRANEEKNAEKGEAYKIVEMVVLKIIKHYQEEGQGNEVVQGVLLGLVVDDRLEITNCFPFPQHTEDDADFDEVQYQMEMMRSLRHVNIDHLHVGWYQSTYYGSFVTRALLDSQFSYQHAIEESVVLIYDPIKTAQGSLSLKAYRLTPKLMEVCKEKDFSPEALKKANIAYENMFEEVPIVIKNSYLINVMLWELEKKSAVADRHELLSLASSNHLGKSLQLLMDRVDEMSQDIVKYNTYLRNVSKQQQQKHQYQQRRQQENMQRQSRGEAPLPEEDINKLFKPPQPPPRMESLLIAGQINTYCQNIKEFNAQNLGKLFMAQALQDNNN